MTTPHLVLPLHIRELPCKALQLTHTLPLLPQHPPNIVPRRLVLRRLPNSRFRIFDFPRQYCVVDFLALLTAEGDEPTMVPGAVVAHVGTEERFDVGEFGVPEGEVADEPLSVGPDVVVFGVFGEHAGQEGELGWWEGGELGHDDLAMVPERGQLGGPAIGG